MSVQELISKNGFNKRKACLVVLVVVLLVVMDMGVVTEIMEIVSHIDDMFFALFVQDVPC